MGHRPIVTETAIATGTRTATATSDQDSQFGPAVIQSGLRGSQIGAAFRSAQLSSVGRAVRSAVRSTQ